MTERRTRWTWAFALVGAAFLQVTRALEGSLHRLHAPGMDPAGYRQLIEPGKVKAAWCIWEEGVVRLYPFHPAPPRTIVLWHVAADNVFVVCLLLAMTATLALPGGTGWGSRLWALLHRPWGLFAVAAGTLDVAGNLAEAWIAERRPRFVGLAGVGHWLFLVELFLIGLALLCLVVAKKGELRMAAVYVYRSAAVLRVLLVLDVGFVVLLYAGPMGSQTEDVVQRWLEGNWTNGLFAVGGYAVFVAVVRSGRWLCPTEAATGPWKLLACGVGLTVGGAVVKWSAWAGRGTGLLVLGLIILVVGLLEWTLPDSPTTPDNGGGRRLRAAVAAVPAFAIGLLLVRTGVNHAVVADHSFLLLLFGALALALAPLAWSLCQGPLEVPWPRRHFVVQAVLVTLMMIGVGAWFPTTAGSFAVLLFALAELAAIALALRAAFLSKFAPKAFRAVGFGRTPVVTVVVVWIGIASAWNGAGNGRLSAARITYYDARTAVATTAPIGIRGSVDTTDCMSRTKEHATDKMAVRQQFCDWVAARSIGVAATSEIPLVLVTASGGGVRAAAWTEKVLDCLFLRDDPVGCAGAEAGRHDRWPQLFAANGASGGSVGIASTVAERLSHTGRVPVGDGEAWYRSQQRDDTMAPLLGHTLLRDTFVGMFGIFLGRDRASSLEDAWEQRWSTARAVYCLGKDPGVAPRIGELGFVTLRDRCAAPIPFMLFNGTDANTGRRVNLAPSDLDNSKVGDLRAPPDLVDYLERKSDDAVLTQDLPLFTAAFLSARFPFVTPSGRLPTCRVPGEATDVKCPTRTDAGRQVLNVVDGGYAENDGAAQVAELAQQLLPLVETYNSAGPTKPKVRVVLVEIENGERAGPASPPSAATGGELFRPLSALLHLKGAGAGTLDALRAGFTDCDRSRPPPSGPTHLRFSMYEHPGRTMPLGWTLARDSLDSVDRQFAIGENRDAAGCFADLVPHR